MQEKGKLYLFPSTMGSGDGKVTNVLPERNLDLLRSIRYFVVEEIRTARRFLKHCDRSIDIDSLSIEVLNEHTPSTEIAALLTPALEGNDIGIISEAGCPAVADPGADLVAEAHRRGIQVIPLVGPSSILLALMASGFSGQNFAFRGYLPREQGARKKAFRDMERNMRDGQTQIFIETPYRNNRLIDELSHTSMPGALLCVASDLTGENEKTVVLSLADWAHTKYDYDKIPAIFLLSF